ncbi:hypothetical protein [Caldibacillus thermoamylovorans]|uniref:hypothetical protein n=1 Tax=Bacillaceae TaxID=186817 RepID=UPI00204248CD|nr:hypothetical protein [Caldibacillus thermoamylovorans]MCM3056195.1 hypothetical protein [Caldibacillus thermoamylovorans]
MLFLIAICVLIFFVGCNSKINKSDSENWADSLENVQKIEVISPEENPILTISDKQEVEDFVNALKIDKWEMKDVPSDAIKGKQFDLYQQKTIKFGESSKDKKELKHVASITTYKKPYLDFNLDDVKFSFKIPKEVFEYLSEYQ